MPDNPIRVAFNHSLAERVRKLRQAQRHPDGSMWAIKDMADTMGVGEEIWRAYETRVPLPHYLIPRLARICGRSVEYVLTGREPKGRYGSDADGKAA